MQDWRPNKLLLKRLGVPDPFVHMPALRDGLIDGETAVILAAGIVGEGSPGPTGTGLVGGGGVRVGSEIETQPSWADLEKDVDLLLEMFN